MKVIIAGGRELNLSFGDIQRCVEASGFCVTEVVSGGARGVDTAGEEWARVAGIPVKQFPVPGWVWDYLGKQAGMVRNQAMANYGDALIAAPGEGPGTRGMIRLMKQIGKPVWVRGEPNQDQMKFDGSNDEVR